jgi:hypothetical protein
MDKLVKDNDNVDMPLIPTLIGIGLLALLIWLIVC